jgi:ubiquinone/menaquinone biosynthesis C-methylase UbiE
MERILEPEVMDTEAEAIAYDSIDLKEVNTAFAQHTVSLGPSAACILDAGTGTARIPILIAQLRPAWQIVAIDLAQSMLAIAEKNVLAAQLSHQIRLEFVDAKCLPYADHSFDGIISNSLLHHLPNPRPLLQEIRRVLKPQGFLLLQDLLRPDNPEKLAQQVAEVTPDWDTHQTQLFQDSLQAAFTLPEIEDLSHLLGFSDLNIYQSSERHWTLERAYQED